MPSQYFQPFLDELSKLKDTDVPMRSAEVKHLAELGFRASYDYKFVVFHIHRTAENVSHNHITGITYILDHILRKQMVRPGSNVWKPRILETLPRMLKCFMKADSKSRTRIVKCMLRWVQLGIYTREELADILEQFRKKGTDVEAIENEVRAENGHKVENGQHPPGGTPPGLPPQLQQSSNQVQNGQVMQRVPSPVPDTPDNETVAGGFSHRALLRLITDAGLNIQDRFTSDQFLLRSAMEGMIEVIRQSEQESIERKKHSIQNLLKYDYSDDEDEEGTEKKNEEEVDPNATPPPPWDIRTRERKIQQLLLEDEATRKRLIDIWTERQNKIMEVANNMKTRNLANEGLLIPALAHGVPQIGMSSQNVGPTQQMMDISSTSRMPPNPNMGHTPMTMNRSMNPLIPSTSAMGHSQINMGQINRGPMNMMSQQTMHQLMDQEMKPINQQMMQSMRQPMSINQRMVAPMHQDMKTMNQPINQTGQSMNQRMAPSNNQSIKFGMPSMRSPSGELNRSMNQGNPMNLGPSPMKLNPPMISRMPQNPQMGHFPPQVMQRPSTSQMQNYNPFENDRIEPFAQEQSIKMMSGHFNRPPQHGIHSMIINSMSDQFLRGWDQMEASQLFPSEFPLQQVQGGHSGPSQQAAPATPENNGENQDERRRRRSRSRDNHKRRRVETDEQRDKRKKGFPTENIPDTLNVTTTTLWLGRLPANCQDNDIREALRQWGEAVSITIIPPKACAYVVMENRKMAYDIMKYSKDHRITIQKRDLKLGFCLPNNITNEQDKATWDKPKGHFQVKWVNLVPLEQMSTYFDGCEIDIDTLPLHLKGIVDQKGRIISQDKEETQQPQFIDPLQLLHQPYNPMLGLPLESMMSNQLIAPLNGLPLVQPNSIFGLPHRLPGGNVLPLNQGDGLVRLPPGHNLSSYASLPAAAVPLINALHNDQFTGMPMTLAQQPRIDNASQIPQQRAPTFEALNGNREALDAASGNFRGGFRGSRGGGRGGFGGNHGDRGGRNWNHRGPRDDNRRDGNQRRDFLRRDSGDLRRDNDRRDFRRGGDRNSRDDDRREPFRRRDSSPRRQDNGRRRPSRWGDDDRANDRNEIPKHPHSADIGQDRQSQNEQRDQDSGNEPQNTNQQQPENQENLRRTPNYDE